MLSDRAHALHVVALRLNRSTASRLNVHISGDTKQPGETLQV